MLCRVMKQIEASKKITEGQKKKIRRMSKKAIQTVAVIQNSTTLTKASEKLGITRSALYERIKRYDLMPIIAELKREAQTTIDMASPEIASELVEVAQGTKVSKQELEAKKDVLDRAGIVKKVPQTAIGIQSKGDMSIEFIET